MSINPKDYLVTPGATIQLNELSSDPDTGLTKKEYKAILKSNVKEIIHWQERLYAESEQSLLIILQALDAGGKDGTIRKVFGPINPQGCTVSSFKSPTKEELGHDFLWRIHKKTPAKGMIKIFNRSHYEDVLVVKVHDWIDEKECDKRFAHINDFEKLLSDSNTRILKFFLHITKDEQKRRFQDRLNCSEKHWKFSSSDLSERALWDKYMTQFERVFKETSTGDAPWFIIPANDKKYRNAIISTIVLEAFKEMNPQFPPPENGLDKITIE